MTQGPWSVRVAAPRSVAALAALDLVLKLVMSTLRSRGARGEGDPRSRFEKIHTVQLLHAESSPPIYALALALLWRAASRQGEGEGEDYARDWWAAAWLYLAVFGRYCFALRALDDTVCAKGYNKAGRPGDGVLSVFGLVGATSSYVAQAGLLWLLC
jgi:hypothetical protein